MAPGNVPQSDTDLTLCAVIRNRLVLIAVCAALGAGAALPAVAGASSSPQGKLTSTEYKLISEANTAFGKALGGKAPNWTAARSSCAMLGSSTPLLAGEHSDCAAQAAILQAFISFPAAVAKCGNKSPKEYVCALPLYATLSRDASAFAAGETAAHTQATKRQFSGLCLATLSAPPSVLAKERVFASLTDSLYRTMQIVVKVTEGKASASTLKMATVNAEIKQFEKLGTAVVARNSPSNLSVCPHA